MKGILIISVMISACASLSAQSVWQPVASPVGEDLVSVCFVNMQNGWILSEEGSLISTDDGGQSWHTATLGSGNFTSVYFTDLNSGCITGYQDSSFIMLTADGGANWTISSHPKALRLNDAYLHDATHIWVVGINDNLNYNLYTDDGGIHWFPQMNIFVQGAELFSVSFRDGQFGNACGAAGAFFTTSSAGTTGWALDISIPSLGVDLYSVFNWGLMTGCAVGSEGTALYTTSRWSSYVETATNTDKTLYAVSGDPVTNWLWAVGEDGIIIFTSNYVFGWVLQTSGSTQNLRDVDMIDAENGWAVGDNGTILRFGSNTGLGESSVASRQSSVTVFPNPTHGIVDLQYTMYNLQSVTMKIYDMHGREVMLVLDQEMRAGEHVVQADMSGLPEGVYFCKLAGGSRQLAVGKVVKLSD